MRHSLLVTCLFLTAWADPAGSLTDRNAPGNAAGVSVVEKTTDGRGVADEPHVGPAETTKQLIEFDDVSVTVAVPQLTTPTLLSGDALAALDAVADGLNYAPPQAVPLPVHRPIPHTEVCEALASAAVVNDVPTPFFIRLIWQESGFRQNVVSPAGAQGVAQFMPATAAEHGLHDPFNPLQAVRASARLLRNLIHQFGNVGLAAAAYNAGPRRVQEWIDKKGKLPQETQNYVERITGKKAEVWKAKAAAVAPIRVPARAPCQREAGLYAANGPELIPLPPIQVKDEPVKIAKATAATMTKTASAKSVAKVARDPDKDLSKVATKIATKDQSKITTASADKTPKTEAKSTARSAGKAKDKGKKVKVADAEGRK